CDTRNDILLRDLTAEVVEDDCRVLSGTLLDPYTGQAITFLRGQDTSSEVQIDHVVALLNGWETGAQQLSYDTRVRFANDPLNLLAVDGRTNSQKGAGDAATWLPPATSYRCEYVSRQVQVKARYGLWVTQAEHNTVVRVLSACQ
ncbi:MAG: HNH endonuclease family protein, partial [Ilumatobacteraceae bacterium]|nr:HNH endonuclease family protein [Ilumatobacteraceae bacterium]